MIIIAPFAKPLRVSGKEHPKNYPYWDELIPLIKQPIVQVGVKGEKQLVEDFRQNLSLTDLRKLIDKCDTWISVDSFFQHLCWEANKKGIVLFGVSDPNIFGHSEHVNLLTSRSFLRPNQFSFWEEQPLIKEAFVKPKVVIAELNKLINGHSLQR